MEQKTPFLQHPSLHYSLIMLLGSYGVYISMPIDFYPKSTVEWIDLVINLIIFIPCSLIAVISGLFAILCAVFSKQIDERGRFMKFASIILKLFGIRNLQLSEFAHFGPVDLVVKVFSSLVKKQ